MVMIGAICLMVRDMLGKTPHVLTIRQMAQITTMTHQDTSSGLRGPDPWHPRTLLCFCCGLNQLPMKLCGGAEGVGHNLLNMQKLIPTGMCMYWYEGSAKPAKLWFTEIAPREGSRYAWRFQALVLSPSVLRAHCLVSEMSSRAMIGHLVFAGSIFFRLSSSSFSWLVSWVFCSRSCRSWTHKMSGHNREREREKYSGKKKVFRPPLLIMFKTSITARKTSKISVKSLVHNFEKENHASLFFE